MQLDPIFLLAGCEARRAALSERAREALARADFDGLARELAARRLLPLIGTRAVEAAPDLAPRSFREAVAEAVAGARARALAVEAGTRTVTAALGDAGIAALPLKGPLLAEEAHGDVGLRETADVDVLVDPGRIEDAVRVLEAAGFERAPGEPAWHGLPDLHFGLAHPRLPSVDVHWRVHWYENDFSRDMLRRAAPGPDGLLRAQPDDLAAALLLFYARDGFHGVRLAADIAAWWDRNGAGVGHGFLESHARRHPRLAPALTAAAAAAERVTGTPAVAWLGEAAATGRRVGVATRLADWTQSGDRDQLAANVSLVDGLLGPRGSLGAFARRQLFAQPGGRPAGHAAKMCARYALALWRVRGGREWAPAPGAG
jgi:hypothetical protein